MAEIVIEDRQCAVCKKDVKRVEVDWVRTVPSYGEAVWVGTWECPACGGPNVERESDTEYTSSWVDA